MNKETKSIRKNRTINGIVSDGNKFFETPITVRVTADHIGKSISLSVDGLIMLQIPVEPVSDILDIAGSE